MWWKRSTQKCGVVECDVAGQIEAQLNEHAASWLDQASILLQASEKAVAIAVFTDPFYNPHLSCSNRFGFALGGTWVIGVNRH